MATTAPHQRTHPSKPTVKASSAYSVASAWERTAQLDDTQLRVIDALAQAVGQRPFPAHLVDEPATAAEAALSSASSGSAAKAAGGTDSYTGSLEDAVLHNANQFHKWHTELEAACASETEQKYKRYAGLLGGYLALCDGLQDKVHKTLGMFDALLTLHTQVASSSQALSGSTEKLLAEKAGLTEFAEALRARLKFFDEYELTASQFAAAAAAPDDADLMPLLHKIDECIAYVAANPQYADAVAYANKFRQLQARAIGLVRGRVQTVLRSASQAVQAAVADALSGAAAAQGAAADAAAAAAAGAAGQQGLTAAARSGSGTAAAPVRSGSMRLAAAGAVLAEGLEVSLLYVRFRAAAEPVLKGLLAQVEAKAGRQEYARLLEECRQLYCSVRQQLVEPHLSAKLASLTGLPLPGLVRAGTEQLLRTSQLEGQLLEQLFGTAAAVGSAARQGSGQQQQPGLGEALRPLLEPLGQLLYDLLRPRFVQLADMDTLAELIDILQHEVLREQLARRAGPGGEALVPTLSRALADLQERLIYRAQAFIKDEVESYVPAGDDLAYPAKLEAAAAKASAAAAAGEITEDAGEDADGAQAAAAAAGQWYPPVRSTLLLLSKLYRCIDTKIFAGLAQEAVAACTACVQAAGRQVAKQSGALDGQLFVIQHLLFLREQIAQFDVEFSATDIDLDFTHMRDHMRRIMSGEASLFTLSSRNAMVQMLGKSGPRVVAASIDSKRDLEAQLKACCEAFIMGLTKAAVEPMLGFITKVTAVRLAAGSNAALAKPLKQQAFGAPAKLAELVSGVNEAMQSKLPATVAKTQLYLPNPATRAILFRPVKSNIAEAHGQIAALLEAEYDAEEAGQVPLMQPDQLKGVLDELA
ncbi:hypothetical protein OEZ85_003659 [Tetradesmus obliquus]|uniref:Conserved oligomeric Golgi complex subunit 3 n=1 Tax=Tetradesmus obliquus TaxID=3088 RepID=A0ABY8UF93_TETOB|nr:hypothetical protein OEZ85_003659 [Tetradesmus obliquus]